MHTQVYSHIGTTHTDTHTHIHTHTSFLSTDYKYLVLTFVLFISASFYVMSTNERVQKYLLHGTHD